MTSPKRPSASLPSLPQPGELVGDPYAHGPRMPAGMLRGPGFLVSHAALRLWGMLEERLAEHDMTMRHHGLLVTVAELGPISQQEAGAILRTDRTTMVAVADDAERRGWISRERDPADRRRYALTLTPEGIRMRELADRLTDEAEATLLEPLNGAERDALGGLLQKLARAPHPDSASLRQGKNGRRAEG